MSVSSSIRPKYQANGAVGYDFRHGPIDPPRGAWASPRMYRLE
jgi:hypothetical protein